MAMGKVQHRQLSKKEWETLRRQFIDLLQKAGTKKEGVELLLDLLTKSEIIMIARRILIAQSLLKGNSLMSIVQELHVGLATVQQVDRSLEQGLPFYRELLRARSHVGQKRKKGRIPLDPNSFRGLRARYPSHFALVNLLIGDPHMYEEE